MRPIRIALVGAGSMAANHARAIAGSDRFALCAVIDRDDGRARWLADQYGARATTNLAAAFECEAAIIANATAAHFDAAMAAINAGVHVLIEKPLTPTLRDSQRLIEAAAQRDTVMMCGLVERFNPAFATALATHDASVTHLRTTRVGPAPENVHSGIVDDVLIHDLDLVLLLTTHDPLVQVSVHACDRVRDPAWPETVTCNLRFASGLEASLHASRVASARQRSLDVVRGTEVCHLDLLRTRGDALGKQLARFAYLIRRESAHDRDAERQSLWPCHELATRVQSMVTDSMCIR